MRKLLRVLISIGIGVFLFTQAPDLIRTTAQTLRYETAYAIFPSR